MNYGPFKISNDSYYKTMLKVINCFINLTDFEIELISNMFLYNIKVLNKETRLELRSILKASEHNFNNYIKKLKDKGVLLETNYGLAINSKIVNAISDKKVTIEFDVIKDLQTQVENKE